MALCQAILYSRIAAIMHCRCFGMRGDISMCLMEIGMFQEAGMFGH